MIKTASELLMQKFPYAKSLDWYKPLVKVIESYHAQFTTPEAPANENDVVYKIFHNDKVNSILSAALRNLNPEQLVALKDCLVSRTPAAPENDMTAKEFFNDPNGMFTLDFLSEEEQETIFKGAELFAMGKVRQSAAATLVVGEDVYRWVKAMNNGVLSIPNEIDNYHWKNDFNDAPLTVDKVKRSIRKNYHSELENISWLEQVTASPNVKNYNYEK